MKKKTKNTSSFNLFAILLIIASGYFVYFNSLSNQFVWDDNSLITNNFLIQDWNHIKKIFTTPLFYGSSTAGNFYRPIQLLTLLFDYSIWRLHPIGYHLTNISLHVINAILLYFLLRKLNLTNGMALLASLFFTVHPIYTEAVTYISGRADPLSAVFMLISLLLFIRFEKSSQWSIYILSILSFVLALLSKENAIVFPFILLAYDFFISENQKRNGKHIIIFFLISGFYIISRLTILTFANQFILKSTIPFIQRSLLVCKVLVKYLALYIAPLQLHMERTIAIPKSILEPSVLFSIFIIISLFILFKKEYRHRTNCNNVMLFGILWFVAFFVPISNIFPLNAYIAEHWLYAPSMGLIILASAGTKILMTRQFIKKAIIACAIFLFVAYAILTVKQNKYWENELVMYQKTLYYSPTSARICYNLGNVYRGKKLYGEAVEIYHKALSMDPNSFDIHNNLALTYINTGVKDKAIAEFKEALRINPGYAEGYSNLGSIYFEEGLLDEAIKVLKKAVEINKNLINAHDELGIIYSQTGHYDQAITEFEIVLKLDPTRAATYNDLGLLYADTGQLVLARQYWEKALQINPSLNATRNNLKKLEDMGY